MVVIVFFVRFISVPAGIVLGLWFGLQLFSGATTPTAGGGVAFWAHVGGFLAGVALIPVLKRRDVRLFDRPHSRPFEVQTPSRSEEHTSELQSLMRNSYAVL